MKAKIEAFLSRKEIRDVFDIEFLLKKGINLDISASVLKEFFKKYRIFYRKRLYGETRLFIGTERERILLPGKF